MSPRLVILSIALVLAVGATALALTAPFSGAEGAEAGMADGAATVALQGQLVIEHGHYLDGRGFMAYSLLTDDAAVPLRLPQTLAAQRPSGEVSLLGRHRPDGVVVVDQLRVLNAALPPVSTGAQRTAVILLGVAGATNPYAANPHFTAQLVYGPATTSAFGFYHESSYGQTMIVKGSGDTTPDGSGSIFGPYQLPSLTSCSVSTITAQALTLAGTAINPASFDRVVVSLAYPTTPCGFGGVSVIYPQLLGSAFPSQWQGTWLSFSVVQNFGLGTTPAPTPGPTFTGVIGNTFIHEYGHQLGMFHANTLQCGSVAVLGNACASIEYGDKSDVMGNSDAQPGPVHKDVLGWLRDPLVQEVTTSGTYTISGYEQIPTVTPTLSGPPNLTPSPTPIGNARVLKVPRTRDVNGVITSHYYLIFRQPQIFRTYLTPFPLYNQGVLVYTQGTAAMCSQLAGATASPTSTVASPSTPTPTTTPGSTLTPLVTATRTGCIGDDRMFMGSGGGGDSLLINTHASAQTANNFAGAPLLAGQSYSDAAAGVSFTVAAINSTTGQATVQVTFTSPPLVQIQPIVYPGIVLPTVTPGGPAATPQVILPATFSGGGAYARGSPVTLNITPGLDYKFAYWRENRTALPTSTFTVPLRFTATGDRVLEAVFGPMNDTRQTAQVVSALPTQFVINNESSTNSSNLQLCTGTSTPPLINHSVWYQITPSVTQALTASTTGTSEFIGNTILAVWTQGASTPIACNTNGHASTVTWTAQAGTTYYVQAGLLDSGLGGLLLLNFAQGTPTATLSPTPRATTPTATPTAQQLSLRDAIEHVRQRHGRTGQPGVRAANNLGDTAAVSGPVTGTGRVTSSMTWTLTAQVPPGVPAGTVAHAVLSTDVDLEAFPCTPVVAGSPSVTCTGRTTGTALQGSSVVVVFLPGVTAVGTVTGTAGAGAGAAAAAGGGLPIVAVPAPLLPPPPPILVPPPSAPFGPLGGPFAGPALAPEVPVIPEADSLLLVLAGLAALGGLGAWRRLRRRRAG